MNEYMGMDLFEPKALMDTEPSAPSPNFSFAFNDPNFSDRELRIEIVGCTSESREDCLSITEWVQNRKRRKDEVKRGIELTLHHEDSYLLNQPDIEDGEAFDNENEEGVAMIEESPSGGGTSSPPLLRKLCG